MSNQFWTWLVVATAIFIAAVLRPHGTRIFLGFFFIAMGLGVNLTLTLTDPQSFVGLGSHSYLPLYRWVFGNLVARNPVLMVAPVILYEIIIGTLMLAKGSNARLGFAGAIVFLLAITPLNAECLPNPVLALGAARLWRIRWEKSLLDMLRDLWKRHGD